MLRRSFLAMVTQVRLHMTIFMIRYNFFLCVGGQRLHSLYYFIRVRDKSLLGHLYSCLWVVPGYVL